MSENTLYALARTLQQTNGLERDFNRMLSALRDTVETEYLQKIRIEKCCELLAGSEMSIQEIAHSVGYEDAKFFQQVFKRMVKMSPREYRRTALSGRT